MTALQNRIRAGGFVQSEANFARSRDQVTILGGSAGPGAPIYAGTVLAKVTASGKYVAAVNSAGDGSQTAVAVLWEDCDPTDGDVIASVVSRDAEVRAADLTYDSSVDDNTKKATKATQLAAVGIIVRS